MLKWADVWHLALKEPLLSPTKLHQTLLVDKATINDKFVCYMLQAIHKKQQKSKLVKAVWKMLVKSILEQEMFSFAIIEAIGGMWCGKTMQTMSSIVIPLEHQP